MDDQNKNLILAIALSIAVLLGWQVLFPRPTPVVAPPLVEQTSSAPATAIPGAPVAPGTALPASPLVTTAETRAAALTASPRVPIRTARLSGSISLLGGRVDDLRLTDYRETIEEGSPVVTLLSPAGSPDAYYVLHGWAPAGGLDPALLPDATTSWQIESGTTLTERAPLVLVWDNGAGLTFRKSFAIDADYMFTVTQSVTNNSSTPVRAYPYGIIARPGVPKLENFFVLHEGLVQASDGTLNELKYKHMRDLEPIAAEAGLAEVTSVTENGWIGFTDHYWMTTLIPQNGQPFTAVSKYVPANDTYQADMRLPIMDIAAGATVSSQTFLFAGAKEWEAINDYETTHGINQFVDSIDWGWFFFLTKPIFRALHFINAAIGNMGWAIIGLTVLIKTLLFPLAYKSYVSMSKMKKLQPEMEKLKEKAGDDRGALQKEMMALYKREKVNPAAGCLPILVQIPIFFSLYKVIFVTLELRHEPFFGWIRDLSAPDPSSVLNLFGLLPYSTPTPESFFYLFSIGIYPILMGVTMWMQQKLNPTPTDKTQAMIFAWMPWVFMFMLGSFASGLVIYWCANNTLTFTQQYLIMRSQGVKPDVFGNVVASVKRKPKAK